MNIDWDLLIGASSVTIALCALVLTWYQIHKTREFYKLSVKPKLDISSLADHANKTYKVEITNIGLGPALITDSKLIFNGKTLNGDHTNIFNAAIRDFFPNSKYSITTGNLPGGVAMRCGEEFTILQIIFKADVPPDIEKKLNQFDLEIKYESMYGEKSTYTSEENTG